MNEITILAPRWRDKTVLVAEWRIGQMNRIIVTCQKVGGERYYPQPFVVSGEDLRKYPLEQKPFGKFRVVPLDELKEEVSHE